MAYRDSGICHVCHQFKPMNWVDGAGYCDDHVPLQMDDESMRLAFLKAGVADANVSQSLQKVNKVWTKC